MKTTITLTIALVLLLGTRQLSANIPPSYGFLTEDTYIDDIPFDTEKVYNSIQDAYVAQNFQLEEESYVEDIPFNTESIADEHLLTNEPEFSLEDEEFINDIPILMTNTARL